MIYEKQSEQRNARAACAVVLKLSVQALHFMEDLGSLIALNLSLVRAKGSLAAPTNSRSETLANIDDGIHHQPRPALRYNGIKDPHFEICMKVAC